MTQREPANAPSGHTDRVRAIFDDWAQNGRGDRMAGWHEPAARASFDRLTIPSDGWYLDIGCGIGYTVRWAAAKCPQGKAIGIDAAGHMIARARELSAGLANVAFITAPFPNKDLPAERFDAVFSMEVFYYFADVDAALAEVYRLLKPGGQFACVVDFYRENTASHGWGDDLGIPLTLLSGIEWQERFRRAGLKVVEQTRFRAAPGPDVSEWQIVEGSLVTVGRRS